MTEVVLSWESLRALDMDSLPSLEELETWAYSFLSSVGMAGHVVPRPSQILAALVRYEQLVVFEATPTAADGWYYLRGIFLDPDTPDDLLEDLIAHELSHWWLTCCGVRPSLQEHVVEQFECCWRVARYGVYQLTSREVGGFAGGIQALLDTYAHAATPEAILVRAAMVCRVGIVVFDAQGRRVPIGPGFYVYNLHMDEGGEVCAVDRALASNDLVHLHSQDFDGVDLVAVPFVARERRWVALVVTPPTQEAQAIGW